MTIAPVATSLHPIQNRSRSRHRNLNNHSLNRSHSRNLNLNPQPEPQPQPQPEQPQPEPQPQPLPAPEPAVTFQEDILPILQARCAVPGCHAAPNPARGLNLATYAGFEKGSNGGPVFNPGDSKNSKVVQRIDGGGMPPGAPLDDAQIQFFKDWIDEGAKNN